MRVFSISLCSSDIKAIGVIFTTLCQIFVTPGISVVPTNTTSDTKGLPEGKYCIVAIVYFSHVDFTSSLIRLLGTLAIPS